MSKYTLEFWFEYASTYTYLSVMRIDQVAAESDISIIWRPFLLTPIMVEVGMPDGPYLPYPNKLKYMWRDLERRATLLEIPYKRPSVYPPNPLLTARIGLIASRENWCSDFSRKVFHLHWVEGKNVGTEENIRESLKALDKDPDRIMELAQLPENKESLREQTNRAKELGIFGSSSFIVGDELFWGDDRLEEAVSWCLKL